jgi:hypothetical protein
MSTMVARGGTVTSFGELEDFEELEDLEELETLDAELCRVALSVGVLRLAMAEGLEALARGGGHHDLGFASVEAYALERCERSARWVQASRALARRLASLPAIRGALVRGEIGFCMAQVIAGLAQGSEARWLEEARHRTVREMRALAREGADTGDGDGASQMFAVEEEPRVTLTMTVNREDEWLFEHARLLGKHAAGAGADETLDALLAEGTTSLLAETDRSAVVSFDASLDQAAPQRAREQELARFREEAESRCEARFAEKPRAVLGEAHGGDLSWDGGAEAIDAQLRWVAGELAQRDLVLGELADAFWTLGGWRRLGFATESQYARERLGMSLSAVKAKRALARRTRELPHLEDAMKARDLGYEAARLVASVASRDTVESWVERARERTVKHLREEVDAAQMLGRVGVDETMAPPKVTTMEAIAALERRIVAGEAFQLGESQMFAVDGEARTPARLASRGRVALKFHVGEGTRRYYRWLERTYLRHGPRGGSFLRYLCLAFIGAWRERPEERPAYAEIYERDLFQCSSPVCSRRDVTPHHLVFRSHGGDDSPQNIATLCVWCHLEGVHGGALSVEPPASSMRWRLGRRAHTVVQNRKRVRVPLIQS